MSHNLNIWGVFDESSADVAECSRRNADAIRSLVDVGICSLNVLQSWMKHCLYLFLFMAETMLWKEKDLCRIRAAQRDLRGWIGS